MVRESQHSIHRTRAATRQRRPPVAHGPPAVDPPPVNPPRTAAPSEREITFLLGMGRSGTNFLLDLLDTCPTTHCRNEPDELSGGVLEPWSEWKIHRDPDEATDPWPALLEVLSRGGERDRPIPAWKTWLRTAAAAPTQALSKTGFRKLLPGLGGAEYALPTALIRPEELALASHIIKINAAPAVAELFLRDTLTTPNGDARVLHIVRHPAGFLRSWRRRWLSNHDESEVLAANRARIADVLRVDPNGGAFMATIDYPDVYESELLFWRYCTERIRAVGSGNPSYREVSYDELSDAPLTTLRHVFEFLKLAWTEDIEARVEGMTGSSVDLARAYQSEPHDEAHALFARTLGAELCAEFHLDQS